MTAPVQAGEPPAVLYDGQVMHARIRPLAHRFTYRVASLLIDLDRLEEAGRMSRLFSVNRFNLYAFHEADHGPRDGSSLRAHVDRLMAEAGLPRAAGVRLLCYPRVLGYGFNPLSVYYAEGANGRLSALVYEVSNTFGEMHSYCLPVTGDDRLPVRQVARKRFFVSPFIDIDQTYRFSMMRPGDGVRVRILETDRDGPTLSATFSGARRLLTTANLARLFAAMPLHTVKVVAAIHFEAVRLFLKGAPYFSHAQTPAGPRGTSQHVALTDGAGAHRR